MRSTEEVVITGLGVVSPVGTGWQAYWSSLLAGQSGVTRREEYGEFEWPFAIGGQVADFSAKESFGPREFKKQRKSVKVMCREIQQAYASAAMAMEHAGLAEEFTVDPDRLGVVMGSELLYCDIAEVEASYRSASDGGDLEFQAWCKSAMSDLNPLWMLKHLPNMAACHIGIGHDARGHNNSITLGEASSLLAMAEGASIIERGWCDVMIVGGLGARSNLTHMTYKGALNMTSRICDPGSASRPFELNRDGFVVGEGAAALVFENAKHAKARGAKPLARYLGSASAFGDPGNGRFGGSLQSAMTNAMQSAGVANNDIGHVNANGLSSVFHDQAEAQAIKAVLGDTPVTALKSYFGNLGAGTGAVESVAAILALEQQVTPATLNYETPDPECPVNVIHGGPQEITKPAVMKLSQSLTGQSIAMLFGQA